MAVRSNSTLTPKIDKAAVLRAAWATVKGWYSARLRTFKFVKEDFAWALRCAWHDARVALMNQTQRRIDQIEGTLAMLPYGTGSARDREAERSLRAELASFQA